MLTVDPELYSVAPLSVPLKLVELIVYVALPSVPLTTLTAPVFAVKHMYWPMWYTLVQMLPQVEDGNGVRFAYAVWSVTCGGDSLAEPWAGGAHAFSKMVRFDVSTER